MSSVAPMSPSHFGPAIVSDPADVVSGDPENQKVSDVTLFASIIQSTWVFSAKKLSPCRQSVFTIIRF